MHENTWYHIFFFPFWKPLGVFPLTPPPPPMTPRLHAKPTLRLKINVSKSPKYSHFFLLFFFRSLFLLLFCLHFQSFLNIFTLVYLTCRSFCRAMSQSFPVRHRWVLTLKMETLYVKNCIFLLLLYNSVVMGSVGASPESDSDSDSGCWPGLLDSDSDSHHVDSDSDSHPLDSDSRAELYWVRWNFVAFSTTSLILLNCLQYKNIFVDKNQSIPYFPPHCGIQCSIPSKVCPLRKRLPLSCHKNSSKIFDATKLWKHTIPLTYNTKTLISNISETHCFSPQMRLIAYPDHKTTL